VATPDANAPIVLEKTILPATGRQETLVTTKTPGRYSFTVESAAVFNFNGELRELRGAGQGMIDVDSGKQYDLEGTITGNTWLVTLVEKR